MHPKMWVAIALLSLMVAIATGSINTSDRNLTTPTPAVLELPSCKLNNVQPGQPFNFTSPQERTIIEVVKLRYVPINCLVRNFCSIKWFKNAPAGNTCNVEGASSVKKGNYIGLYKENQTLEIQQAYPYRRGNYTCVATNEKETICRTFQLVVLDEPWEKRPLALPNNIDCTNKTASIGSSAAFFCFFFAGDDSKDVTTAWYKKTESSSWVPVSNLNSQETQYEEIIDNSVRRDYSGNGLKPTAGRHLCIREITTEAYGEYRLDGNNSYGVQSTQSLYLSAPSPEPMADLTAVITASVVVVCLLLLTVFMAVSWHFVKLDVIIWRKNRFGATEDADGKTYDAFISYADEDLPFALKIREKLEQAGYTVCVGDIDFTPATTLVEEIILGLNTSRRCLIVISPDFIRARHSTLQVDVAAEQMMQRQMKIVPIIYRDIPSVDKEEIPLLGRILTNVRVVKWYENGTEKFVKQLLVHMPPRRPAPGEIEERNLLDGAVRVQVDEAPPVNCRIAAGTEMDRFLSDVREAEERNQQARGQKENALAL